MSPHRTALILTLTAVPLFFDLGGTTLGPTSDGRYAAVAGNMARADDAAHWLVPHFEGQPHLTKPPLTYWSEALCIRLLGRNELAVRLPSAIGGLLVLLGTFGIGRYLGGTRMGLLAAGVLAVMPLHLVVSRLTLTDGLLAPCWLGVLAGAYLCIDQPKRKRWPVLLWASCAVGLMVKGPLVFVPLLIVLVWLGVGRRMKDFKHMHAPIGLPLALIPIGAWALAVCQFAPEAVEIWRTEVLGRAAGGGEHPQGPWYFFVVFLVGFFPATCMLNLPWNNYPAGSGWQAMRHGEPRTLWVWAILVPLAAFSIPSGKLPTYILPLAPPVAILTALMLERWLNGTYDKPGPGIRPPDVRHTYMVAVSLCTVGGLVALAAIETLPVGWFVPFAIVPIAAIAMQRVWMRHPTDRLTAMTICWLTLIVAVLYGEVALPKVIDVGSPWRQVKDVMQHLPGEEKVITYGYRDYALSYYLDEDVPRADETDELAAALAQYGDRLVVAAETVDWDELKERDAALRDRFQIIYTQAMGKRLVVIPKSVPLGQ